MSALGCFNVSAIWKLCVCVSVCVGCRLSDRTIMMSNVDVDVGWFIEWRPHDHCADDWCIIHVLVRPLFSYCLNFQLEVNMGGESENMWMRLSISILVRVLKFTPLPPTRFKPLDLLYCRWCGGWCRCCSRNHRFISTHENSIWDR